MKDDAPRTRPKPLALSLILSGLAFSSVGCERARPGSMSGPDAHTESPPDAEATPREFCRTEMLGVITTWPIENERLCHTEPMTPEVIYQPSYGAYGLWAVAVDGCVTYSLVAEINEETGKLIPSLLIQNCCGQTYQALATGCATGLLLDPGGKINYPSGGIDTFYEIRFDTDRGEHLVPPLVPVDRNHEALLHARIPAMHYGELYGVGYGLRSSAEWYLCGDGAGLSRDDFVWLIISFPRFFPVGSTEADVFRSRNQSSHVAGRCAEGQGNRFEFYVPLHEHEALRQLLLSGATYGE